MSGERDRACSSTASCRGSRSTSACSRRRADPTTPLLERAQVRRHRRVEPRRVLHGPRRGAQARGRGRRRVARPRRADAVAAADGRRGARARARGVAVPADAGRAPARARAGRHPHRARGRTSGAPHQAALAAFFREQRAAGADAAGDRHARGRFRCSRRSASTWRCCSTPRPARPTRRLAIVQVPPGLTRLVQLAEPATFSFVLLEDIISRAPAQLFPGQPILESAVIRLARDAELELDDEGGRTQLELVEREVRRRRRSDVVRLEVERGRVGRARRAAPRAARHRRRTTSTSSRARSICAC